MRDTNRSWVVKEGLTEAEDAVDADDDILMAKEGGSWRCFILSSSRPHSPLFIIVHGGHHDKTTHLVRGIAKVHRKLSGRPVQKHVHAVNIVETRLSADK